VNWTLEINKQKGLGPRVKLNFDSYLVSAITYKNIERAFLLIFS